ncbi:hypothetical protein [Phenylobacterium ferrooxidans]|uniref:Uncharacterized protein n=1 Tax=Phenylobacterium ferrooxidans TaxID=2982689 RepID=A0ABW6CSJ0_9CAUL
MGQLSPANAAMIDLDVATAALRTYSSPETLNRLLDAVRAEGRLQGRAEKEAEIGMHLICVGEGTDPQLSVRGHQPAIEAVQALMGDHARTVAELNRVRSDVPARVMYNACDFDEDELREICERGWRTGQVFIIDPAPLSAAHPLNDSVAALIVAQREPLKKKKGERDTEFVKRIVQAYHRAAEENAPPMTAEAFEAFDNHSRPHFGQAPAPAGPVVRYRKDGSAYDAAAGPWRNATMLRDGHPDLVVAFPGDTGTADMVRQARRAGLEPLEIATRQA